MGIPLFKYFDHVIRQGKFSDICALCIVVDVLPIAHIPSHCGAEFQRHFLRVWTHTIEVRPDIQLTGLGGAKWLLTSISWIEDFVQLPESVLVHGLELPRIML